MRNETRRPGVIGLPLFFALCACVILWDSARDNKVAVTGDEPHYLVVADGLLPTFEVEQSGPYSREFRNRTISPGGLAARTSIPAEDNTHAVMGPRGLFNVHNLGLPALLSVPYLLGGEMFARFFLILFATLGVAILSLIAPQEPYRSWSLTVSSLVLGLPLLVASSQIYPDLPAGVLCLVCLGVVAQPERANTRTWKVASAVAVSLLPWLHIRFGALSLVCLVSLAITMRRRAGPSSFWLVVVPPFLLSIGLLAFYNDYAFGSVVGPYESDDVQATGFTAMQFVGLLIDQNQGLLVQQPLLLVGVYAIGRGIRERSALMTTASALVATSLLTNSTHWSLYGGWSFNGRFGWTAFLPFSVLALAGLGRLGERHPRLFVAVISTGVAIQLRYLIGVVLQDRDLLPHAIGSWSGTYSAFWRPFEEMLPIFTQVDVAFTRPANLIGISLVGLLFLVGFTSDSMLRLRRTVFLIGLPLPILLSFTSAIISDPVDTPRQWNGDFLNGRIGSVSGSARVVAPPAQADFLTYGPNWRTRKGTYKITISYALEGAAKTPGSLDVFTRTTWKVIERTALPDTAGRTREATLHFTLSEEEAGQLEFRSYYGGAGTMTVWWIRIEPVT